MRIALGTNVLACAEGVGDTRRVDTALRLVEALPAGSVMVPVQTLGELYRVLVGKAQRPPDEARAAVQAWADSFAVADSTWTSMQAALDLANDHQLGIWDALILAVAADARCRLLVSEDLHAGFTWRGVTVVDPFAPTLHPLLAACLNKD